MPLIFPPQSAKARTQPKAKPPRRMTGKQKNPTTARGDRGFYADELQQFLAEHGPSQLSRDILPHLRSLHGEEIQVDPIRKFLKRAHHSTKSLIMRSPDHAQGEGVYTVAKDLADKRRAYPDLIADRPLKGQVVKRRKSRQSWPANPRWAPEASDATAAQ